MRIGVLISGSGTNLQAIIDACDAGEIDGDVVVVLSDKEAAYGLERARKAGIDAVWVDRAAYNTFSAYNDDILRTLKDHQVDLVVMAGYMRLLGTQVLEGFPDAVLNIHPALLPAFPGASGIRDAFEHGVKVAGVTVHFASEAFDEGPIIAQEAVVVAEDDTIETLEAKIHEIEHRIYPHAIQLFVQGRLSHEGRKVVVTDIAKHY
jgi:phosphoribosylglycinamide formyltransferase-1